LIAINYTLLCHLDYALGDQLPNNKLRFSVRVNSAYRFVISFAHCRCRVGVKRIPATPESFIFWLACVGQTALPILFVC